MKLATKELLEAFVNKRNELGETKFSSTKMTDAHIKKISTLIAKKLGMTEKEVENDIEKKIKEFDDIASKAPILYATIQQNIVENEFFTLFQEHEIDIKNASKFDKDIFMDIVDHIKLEHDQFFPLRNFVNHKSLHNPNFVFVPSVYERHKQFNDVDTAAATEKGDFIFNVKFMQKLIDFAHLKGVKPKGKKYVSNGGRIPDDYAYIEFLILHELMHFTYSDFHYQKILKADGKIINWVGDFRSNYLLVKSGYEQLPMGLFNDHINYDRQKTYKEMYDIVKAEFDKLNKNQQNKVSGKLGDLSDDHSHGDQGGDPGDGTGSEAIDDHHGKVERTFNGSGDESKAPSDKRKEGKESSQAKDTSGGRGSDGKDTISNVDYSKVKPKFNWKTLLNNMVSSASEEVDETYQKPNRRNATGSTVLASTGKSAVKPGEVPSEAKLKICVVVDSSGSMHHAAATIFANLEKLIKSSGAILNKNLVLIKFSNSYHEYELDLKTGKYKTLSAGKPNGAEGGSIKNLFSEFLGSSTNFTSPLVHELKTYASKNYNILILTDTDILTTGNFEELQSLYKAHKKSLFMIFDNENSFVAAIKQMKEVSKNFSYFA